MCACVCVCVCVCVVCIVCVCVLKHTTINIDATYCIDFEVVATISQDEVATNIYGEEQDTIRSMKSNRFILIRSHALLAQTQYKSGLIK